jgi:hypothetical protein
MDYVFYTWIEDIIEYEDGSGNIVKLLLPIHESSYVDYSYSLIVNHYYDPDFYDIDFYHDIRENPLQDLITNYDKKILFKDGIWWCNTSGKKRIEDICAEYSIPFHFMKIICIFKQMNGAWST